MNQIVKNISVIAWFILCFSCHQEMMAQGAMEELQFTGKRLESKKFKLKMQYKLYESYSSGQSIEDKNFSITVWGMEMSMKVEGIDMIRTFDKSLYVDHLHKMIILQTTRKKNKKDQLEALSELMNIDSIIKASLTVKLLKTENGQRIYRIQYKSGNILNYTDAYVNGKTMLLDKVCMYYAKGMDNLLGNAFPGSKKGNDRPRLEITFSDYDFLTERPRDDLSFMPFLLKKLNKYTVTSKFTNYEFFNYTRQ